MYTLNGRVLDKNGTPIPGATVRLYGGDQTLGADPRAAVDKRGAVTWTRHITGYGGTLWNAWQKFVARDVSGITWEEFRLEASQQNPSLRETDELMLAESTYYMPENRVYADTRGSESAVVWDRQLTGYEGSIWHGWQRYVESKVVGLNWQSFRDFVVTQNPSLTTSGGFLADQTYLLPRNADQDKYYRATFATASGRFSFRKLSPGIYRLGIAADGFLRYESSIEVTGDQKETVTLEWIEFSVDRGDESFVKVYGRDFVLDGHTFSFMGVNLRGLAHYGLVGAVRGGNAEQQLNEAKNMGVRVVRIFLPHHQVSAEETRIRLINLLKLMERMDMYLIVALANLYSDVDFRVPGDDKYYTHKPHGETRNLLNVEWFREGYKENYLPFVRTIVSDDFIRRSPHLMAYNIGNELKAESKGETHNIGHPDVLVDFMHTMARKISKWDGGNHLISTGMISTRHAHMGNNIDLRKKLYNIPELHFITNHAYHGDDDDKTSREQEYEATSRENDHDLVHQLSRPKPVLVEESGFEYLKDRHDRSQWVMSEMRTLLEEQKAGGYMPWAFMAGDQDNGDGDNKCGMDTKWHRNDWDTLHKIYRDWAEKAKSQSRPVTIPTGDLTAANHVFTRVAVNLRQEHGLSAEIVTLLPANTVVELQGSSRSANSLVWWPVQTTLSDGSTVKGWIAQTAPSGEVLLMGI